MIVLSCFLESFWITFGECLTQEVWANLHSAQPKQKSVHLYLNENE